MKTGIQPRSAPTGGAPPLPHPHSKIAIIRPLAAATVSRSGTIALAGGAASGTPGRARGR